jgi:hypothetical protein
MDCEYVLSQRKRFMPLYFAQACGGINVRSPARFLRPKRQSTLTRPGKIQAT